MFKQICDLAPGENAGQLALVILPGAGMRASDFRVHGFVEAIRRRCLAVDAIMMEIEIGDYASAAFGQRLKRTVQEILHARGYARLAGRYFAWSLRCDAVVAGKHGGD